MKRTITERVTNILKHAPAARSSDRELIIIYMQKCGMDLDQRQLRIFRDMPSMETIRRVRQSVQAQGLYPASNTVKAERQRKALVMQQLTPGFKTTADLEHELVEVRPWGIA